MNNHSKYIEKDGAIYIKVDEAKVGLEIENLKLIIRMSRERIESLQAKRIWMDHGSDRYYEIQDALNDYERIILDAEDRYEDLLNMPGVYFLG